MPWHGLLMENHLLWQVTEEFTCIKQIHWIKQVGCKLKESYTVLISAPMANIASDSGKTTLLWDVSTQQLDFTFINPSDQVLAVEFSHDGKLLGTGGAEGKLYVVEVQTRKTISVMKGHTDWINSISFSSNGSTLA